MKAEEIRCGHFIPIDPNKVPWPSWAISIIQKHLEGRASAAETEKVLNALSEWANTATTEEIEQMSNKTGLDLKIIVKK